MEGHIYRIVNKLSDIYEVDQPNFPRKWVKLLIHSARRSDNEVQPIGVSLKEIENTHVDRSISNTIRQILESSDVHLRDAGAILHLTSLLGSNDAVRRCIKIHNFLRALERQQQLQHQRQQLPQQHQQQKSQHQHAPSNSTANMSSASSSQQPNAPIDVQRHSYYQPSLIMNQSSQPHPPPNGFQQPQTPQAQATPLNTGSSFIHVSREQKQPNALPTNITAIMDTPRSSTNNRYSQSHNHNLSTSIIAITPKATKRDKSSRRSEKDIRRKNDVLHQKMKAFLAENQFLSFDFKKIDWTQMVPIAPLSSMSVQEQESALINDLLYVLIGTEGKYIRMQPSRDNLNKHTIGVERGGDEIVYISATRIIKICPLYSTVVHYAEDVNFGLVNQALSAPIRDLVKEYLNLISNLQIRALRDDMTLQSMWLSLQTIFYRMEALKQILDQISHDSCFGGHTLSVLHNRVMNFSTDPRTHEFCLKLMQAASEPYFEILERWLYLGLIEDPYGEFFIEDTENKSDTRGIFSQNLNLSRFANYHNNPNIDIDVFWRTRFTCEHSKVPIFLRSKQEKIFDTGKYLSVVRHYSKKAFKPLKSEPLAYSPEIGSYDESIDGAYRFASKELIDLLLVQNKLIERLHSLRRYFLFSSGDFFVEFMDMADEELSKPKDEINMARLESLLELALRTSSCNNDPYKDDVHVQMSNESLYEFMVRVNNASRTDLDTEQLSEYRQSPDHLLGWEALTLSYNVPWPLSMIIDKTYCQTLYEMMFRHLFCCKYVERKLEATWRINRLLKFSNYELAFTLRHRMLHFVNNLLFYIVEIIEPSFQLLISKFKDEESENVNEVVELHKAFLSGLVHDSMLTDNELLGHVTKLLLLCMDFSVVLETRFASQEAVPKQDHTENHNKSYVASQVRKLSQNLITKPTNPDDIFQSRIREIDDKFNQRLMLLLNAISARNQDFTASTKLQKIFYRLDFNNFYTKGDSAS